MDISLSRGALWLLFATQLGCCLAQSPVLTPERRRDMELRPGVVIIYVPIRAAIPMLDLECSAVIRGSGFLYRPDGYVITNGHVVQLANPTDEEALKARREEVLTCLLKSAESKLKHKLNQAELNVFIHAASADLRIAPQKLTVMLESGIHYDASIEKYSPPMDADAGGKDVAIIKIDGNNLPTVPLGDSNSVNDHDPIYVLGYPGAADISNTSMLTASGTDGIISAVKAMDNSGSPLLQTNASINHGNSGGPAFDASDKAIGIATLGSQAAGFNFLVPINTAMEFVRQAGAEPQHDIGLFDKTWREALDAYQNKQWSKAHQLANSALEMMPGEPQVIQLQLWASANERSESAFARMMENVSQPALIGVVALLLLCIGGVAITRMKSPPRRAVAMASASPRVLVQPPSVRVIESIPAGASTTPKTFGSLLVANGPLMGNRFPIPKAGLLIGRDPARCALVLPDDTVSGEHAWVVPLDNGVAVIDKNSSNGTYINSSDSPRINKVMLKHGDRIFLGTKNPTSLTYYSE